MAGIIESEGPRDQGRSSARANTKPDPEAETERALGRLRLSGVSAETMREARSRIAANHAHGISWALSQTTGPRERDRGPSCGCGSELVDAAWQGEAILRCDQCGSRVHLSSHGGSSGQVGLSGPSPGWLETHRPLAAPEQTTGPNEADGDEARRYLRLDPGLLTALNPVLTDLERTCPVPMTVEAWSRRGEPGPAAMLWGPGGSGTGLSTDLEAPLAEQVGELADKVQEATVEELWQAGLSATWPVCPQHPDSHPLTAAIIDDRSVWRCPRTLQIVADIGGLAGSGGSRARP